MKLDYEHSRAIFYDPAKFKYAGTGARLPILFRGTNPQARGRVDGIDGVFHIDTGSRASLTLTLPFVEANDLVAKYGAKLEAISGAGAAGHVRALFARATTLQLGDITVQKPVTSLSLQSRGALADPDLAGNIGFGVLRQFNITFDYANNVLYLERTRTTGNRTSTTARGLWVERGDKGLRGRRYRGGRSGGRGRHQGRRPDRRRQLASHGLRCRFRQCGPSSRPRPAARCG